MGGTTCTYSSGGGKKKDDDDRRDGEGIQIIIDTRISGETGPPEPDTGESEVAVVRAALAAPVVPLSRLETSDGSEPARSRLYRDEPVSVAASRGRATSIAVTPEPTAAIVFVTGMVLLVWHLRRRRSA